jgi:predicted metalloprotease with PDZ domain
VVTAIARNSSAWHGGLNVNDEILALNGYRLTDDINKSLAGARPGEPIHLLVNRDGQIVNLQFLLRAVETRAFRLEPVEKPTKEQSRILDKWMTGK